MNCTRVAIRGLRPKRNLLFCEAALRSHNRGFATDPSTLINAMTETLQSVHVYTNLPWYALIPVTTIALRTSWTLPLAILQRMRIQKQNALRPIIAATGPVLRLNLARKASKSSKATEDSVYALTSPMKNMKYDEILVLSAREVRKRQKKLFKSHNVQLYKNFLLPAAQIPLWVCMSMTFRNLSGWSTWDAMTNKPLDTSLYNEGLLWFTDLTASDLLHLFPLAIGIVALINVEWTFKTFSLMKTSVRRKASRPTITDSMANVSRMAIVFLMAISLHAPTALTLYWFTSQLYSLMQNIILDLLLPISFTPNKRLDYKPQTNGNAVSVLNTNK